MGIRLVVVDDNPHLAWEGRVHAANATFQQFVAGLLDLPGSPVASISSCVPLRHAEGPPTTLPLDARIEVVGTAPFDGIAGYLRHLPGMLGANRAALRHAIGEADLLWLKVPASNATLAAAIARRAGTPRFVWVAGSAAEVAGARFDGLARLGAGAVGLGYDAIGRLAGVGGHRLVVGEGLVAGDGIVASLVEAHELRDPGARPWAPGAGQRPARLVWAGRLAAGKGLEALLGAVAADPTLELDILGDGPDRERLAELAATLRDRRPGPVGRSRRGARDVPRAPGRGRRVRLPVAGRRLSQGRARCLRGRPARAGDAGRCAGRTGRGRSRRADRRAAARCRARRVAPTRRDRPARSSTTGAGEPTRSPPATRARRRPPGSSSAGGRGGRTCRGSAERVGSRRGALPGVDLLGVARRPRLGVHRVPGHGRAPRPGAPRPPGAHERGSDADDRHRRPRRGRPHRRPDRGRAGAGGQRRPDRGGARRLGRVHRRDRGDRGGHGAAGPPGPAAVPHARWPDGDPGGALRRGPRRRRRPDRCGDPLRAGLPRRAGRGAARPARRLRDRPPRVARRAGHGDLDPGGAVLALRAARPRAGEPGRRADRGHGCAPRGPSGHLPARCR